MKDGIVAVGSPETHAERIKKAIPENSQAGEKGYGDPEYQISGELRGTGSGMDPRFREDDKN